MPFLGHRQLNTLISPKVAGFATMLDALFANHAFLLKEP